MAGKQSVLFSRKEKFQQQKEESEEAHFVVHDDGQFALPETQRNG